MRKYNFLQNSDNVVFLVQSETNKKDNHTVDFSIPFCTCTDYSKFRFPRKHICAIIQCIPDYSFSSLPNNYVNSPFVTIDPQYSFFKTKFLADSNESNSGVNINTPRSDSLVPVLSTGTENCKATDAEVISSSPPSEISNAGLAMNLACIK